MALRRYNKFPAYRRKMNSLLKLLFQNGEVTEMEVEYKGEVPVPATVQFLNGTLSGVTGGIHNYIIFFDLPEHLIKNFSLSQNQEIHIEEVNSRIRFKSPRITVYPWNRNKYEDNDIDLEHRAEYFVLVFLITINWLERKLMEPQR